MAVVAALLFPVVGYFERHGITATPLGDVSFLHEFALLLTIALWGLLKLIQLMYFAVRLAPASMLVKFLQFAIVVLTLFAASYVSGRYFDQFRWNVHREFYESKFQKFSFGDQDEIEAFFWGETGFAGRSFFAVMVRDKTGRIADPAKAWGPRWWEKVPRYIRPCGNEGKEWGAQHFLDDLYIVRYAC